MRLVRTVFGEALNPVPVRVRRRRWLPLQPVGTVMAPCGHLHFHPASPSYRDDFSGSSPELQGLFIHEMTHVWQAQSKGAWFLPLMRHPLCRYDYRLREGWEFERYGIEQQAEIVRHAFLLSIGHSVPGEASLDRYREILPFSSALARKGRVDI